MARTLWETLRPLEQEHARLQAQLKAVEAKMEEALRTWAKGGTVPAAPKAKAQPKKGGRTLTDRVLAQVTQPRDAASITASLALKASDRRRVYDVLKKAAANGRIKSLGEGKFGPKR